MKKKTVLSFVFAGMLYAVSYAQPVIVKQRAYGTTDQCFFNTIIKATDGGLIIAGSSYAGIGADKSQPNKGADFTDDFWIIKLDSSGNKVWDKSYGGDQEDMLYAITPTSDHGYILGGYSYSNAVASKSEPNHDPTLQTGDYWVIKIDSLGRKQWDKTVGGSKDEILFALDTTMDGGYILGGYSESNVGGDRTDTSYGYRDYWVVKLDGSGNKVWDRSFGTFDEEQLLDVKHTSDSGYILAGYLGLIKLDKNGEKVWNTRFPNFVIDKVMQTPDGNYIAGGSSEVTLDGTAPAARRRLNYWLVTVDASGNVMNDRVYGGNRTDQFYSFNPTSDGGLIVAGVSESPASGNKSENSRGDFDYWIVKLNKYGKVQWDKTLGGDRMEAYVATALEYKPNEYIIGGNSTSGISGDRTRPAKGTNDYWLVGLQYKKPAETPVFTANQITEKRLNNQPATKVSIYPNPAKDVLHVQYSGKASFALINTSGAVVLTKTINGNGQINIAHLPAGVYYLQNTATGDQHKIVIE